MSVQVEIKGLKELSEALRQMPLKIQGKALGASVAAGAGVVRKEVVARARATFKDPTGATERSIVSYRKRGSRPDNIGYQIGVTMKKKWPQRRVKAASGATGRTGKANFAKGRAGGAYWWRFSEFGTTHQAATPWFRPGWDTSAGRALAAIKIMLQKAVAIAATQVPKYKG